MLRQRIVTALVLVALVLGSLLARNLWPFALLTLLLVAAAGWEWARLNQAGHGLALAMGAAVALAGGAALNQGWSERAPTPLWWGIASLWVVCGAMALRTGPAAWPQLARPLRWGLGMVALWAAWLALTEARVIGINFMLSILCLVWMADIAAYFGGRAFGRRKLALSISPGKSWEGVWSGMVAVVLLGLFWTWLDTRFDFGSPSLYSSLVRHLGWTGAALALLALAGLSVVGDLVESLVKRAAGAKDSSRLLPGHGGVLDRIDALLPVLPAAMALMSIRSV
ncbi:MAG TPA: phosphatidate cytidylyltransferase [Rubrivivax sp.]|nr:phosphatidate cytidylyltransferase [Rubrivivax sp.]